MSEPIGKRKLKHLIDSETGEPVWVNDYAKGTPEYEEGQRWYRAGLKAGKELKERLTRLKEESK